MRVAALTSKKAAARRRGEPLAVEPPALGGSPDQNAARRETLARIIAEVAKLPGTARAVVTLCVLEGHTAKEAARVLDIPHGTADTRLAAAKALLRKRLTRLGLAPSLLALLADPTTTASAARHAARLAELAPLLARGAPPTILALTVTGGITMTTAKILTAVALVGCGAGAAGWGVWRAGAGDGPVAKVAAPPAAPKPPAGKLEALPLALADKVKQAATTRKTLAGPSGVGNVQNLSLGQLFDAVQTQHNVFIRFDYAALQRFQGLGGIAELLSPDIRPLETKVKTDITDANVPLRDFLEDVLARTFSQTRLALSVRGNQILVGPAYFPMSVPGVKKEPDMQTISNDVIYEMYNGPPVSASFQNATLAEVVAELRVKTGQNIVVKLPPDMSANRAAITATFDAVRLATVLEVVGDMTGLRPVVLGNVFYLTDEASAERLQQKVNREVFGRPVEPGPAWGPGGLGTPGGMGGFGGGIGGGGATGAGGAGSK